MDAPPTPQQQVAAAEAARKEGDKNPKPETSNEPTVESLTKRVKELEGQLAEAKKPVTTGVGATPATPAKP